VILITKNELLIAFNFRCFGVDGLKDGALIYRLVY